MRPVVTIIAILASLPCCFGGSGGMPVRRETKREQPPAKVVDIKLLAGKEFAYSFLGRKPESLARINIFKIPELGKKDVEAKDGPYRLTILGEQGNLLFESRFNLRPIWGCFDIRQADGTMFGGPFAIEEFAMTVKGPGKIGWISVRYKGRKIAGKCLLKP